MGNDVQKSVIITEKATEVTAYWSMYGGQCNDARLSLFKCDTSNVADIGFWSPKTPLEKSGKNLMLLRHPNILKFVSTWTKGGEVTVATEHARPLILCLKQHNAIQICLGLRSVVQAATFLVETANVRHLNIGLSSIYVTDDGSWKLSGFEFLYQPHELTAGLLETSLRHRYQKAVDETNEAKSGGLNLEQFAFAVLCKDIFTMHPQKEDAPFLKEFQEFCRENIQSVSPQLRPKLSTILQHSYFNQDFVKVHEFLSRLPLKSAFEKQEFFTDLIRTLRTFDERDVAVHLGDLLLSRMVLLDETAQTCVTPFVLDPKTEELVPGLFTTPTFVQYIVPKLKQIFTVHDLQIRMILLEHFHKFMATIPEQELKEAVLPQLLLGIKDNNDHLVSMTLRCLADLVPILGASVVIGKNRSRIFSDGRPQRVAGDNNPLTRHWPEARSITPVMEAADDGLELCQQSFADLSTENLMPVRLAPDGGEDSEEVIQVPVDGVGTTKVGGVDQDFDDEDRWSDWENDPEETRTESQVIVDNTNEVSLEAERVELVRKLNTIPVPPVVDDLNELDIVVKPKRGDDEMDFFRDMEPTIVKQEVDIFASHVREEETEKKVPEKSNRLSIQVTSNESNDQTTLDDDGGWGGDGDWE